MTPTDRTLYIDASTLEGRYSRCPRSYHYHAMLKRESDDRKAGRAFGRVMHKCIADHYLQQPIDVPARHLTESSEIGDDYRTAAYAQELLSLYTTSYATEPFDVVSVDGAPIIEKAFAVPLGTVAADGGDITVIWTGIIDLVTRWSDGTTWTVDHKTSKIAGETFWAEFSNSTAQIGYCWAWHRLFGTEPAGYVINALFTRQPTRTGKGMEVMRQKFPLNNSAAVFAQWERNVLHLVAEMLDNAERGYWPMHTGSCKTPYGMCEYLPVCRLCTAGEPAAAEALLNSNMYRNVTWDPLQA